MTEQELSATDTVLRERITELSVHIPCGGIRGPFKYFRLAFPPEQATWQSCRDEDSRQVWEGCDVSREYDLCIVCFRATAGGRSRWAWLACENCRAVNDAIGARWGLLPFALGRHSLMNGIGVRIGRSPVETEAEIARLADFAKGDHDLRDWRRREYARLARKFDPSADVPLKVWQQEWEPSRSASVDAFARILGD